MPGNHAVVSEKWRYIVYADGSEELYDREADPNEFTNLAGDEKYAAVKRELAQFAPKTNALSGRTATSAGDPDRIVTQS